MNTLNKYTETELSKSEYCTINGGTDPTCGCNETGRSYAKALKDWWNSLDLNPFN